MTDVFMIGVTTDEIYDFFPLDQILETMDVPIDPDWSFQPFATSVRNGNGHLVGQGFSIAKWRWNGMSETNRQLLKDFCTGLSADVFIRTPTNEIDSDTGERIWKTFAAVMNWPDQDEDLQADKVLGLILTFTHLEEVDPE